MAVFVVGCTVPTTTVLPAPIPLALQGGALTATASVDGVDGTFPVIIDTGTPLTAYDDHSGQLRVDKGRFRLYSAESTPVARLLLDNVPLYVAPLRSVGEDGSQLAVSGLLGGDNLSRFAVSLDYRGTPTMSLKELETTCSCPLASACQAVFPYTLQGGQNTIALGGDLYTYPATRVVLDVCVEPDRDPVSADLPCIVAPTEASASPTCITPDSGPRVCLSQRYLSSGSEMKLLVATGFPGVALGASAYDRLRGVGAAAAALATPVQLHLPDVADDGASSAGLSVGRGVLGTDQLSALAVVSHEAYFGPCGELARSRRQRRVPPNNLADDNPHRTEIDCLLSDHVSNGDDLSPVVRNCLQALDGSDKGPCNDADEEKSPTAAVIELVREVPIYVLADSAPILQSVNDDVRPSNATVDGIIGTEVLSRLVSTIDYSNNRVIARCATDDGCLTYPRYFKPNDPTGCEADCVPPSKIPVLSGGLCSAAPARP